MTGLWVVLVGPGPSCRPLITTRIAAEAVEALDVLRDHAPSLRVCLYLETPRGYARRILVRDGGLTTIEAPELFQALTEAPAPAADRAVHSAPQPADLVVDAVEIR